MACFSPLKAYEAYKRDADKKRCITFRPSSSIRWKPVPLPCGQCIGCRKERSRQWAVRCMHEAQLHEENCFITLTFNDENLPKDMSLRKMDFQLFMKRLRKVTHPGIRYYACGEYGEKNNRPHYHALLFGYDFPDKKFFSERNGNRVFTSDTLSKVWPFGFAVVGGVAWDSASYVAGYVMKKITGKMAEEHYNGRVPEFALMSRGCKRLGTGGIGKAWYDKFKGDVYPRDRVIVRSHATRPPRFYDTLLGREDRSTLELIKLKREKDGNRFVSDVLSNGTKIRVSDNDSFRLKVREEVCAAELSMMKRNLEE